MRLSLAPSPRLLRRLFGGLLVLVFPLLVVACGGGDLYSVKRGQVAQRFLPPERTVHHPDSLRALTITEEDGKLQYQLDRGYQSLIENWSASPRNVGVGSGAFQSRTYATLQSLELALVSLQAEMGILGLQKEKARKIIDKRRKKYFDRIRIDVYWFTGRRMDGVISGPGARTEIEVGDRTLQPIRTDHGPLREAYLTGGDVALYRRNTLVFPRVVNETDVLKNSTRIRLTVRPTGSTAKVAFSWKWGEQDQ
ncbi:MAG: hypothetical protein ABEL51_11840 [Salinibacter sp.]